MTDKTKTRISDTPDGHEYVDLGLPSGTLWATCNIGANSPEEYGDYFAWGEIQPKTVYNWNTYKYCNGDSFKLTKYCNKSNYGNNGFTDNLTTLEPSDDAATANWGSDWCMPTEEQWDELGENTTNMWTKQNGVAGRLFTSKQNGQILFLPATGHHEDGGLINVGLFGVYWASSLSTDYPSYPSRACDCNFASSYYSMYGSSSRFLGLSVRAVRSARQN